jgi:RNase adapter protein RapZ
MALFLTSFGYKYGIPHDSDVIFDVRFLPNPYFVAELRGKTGSMRSQKIRVGKPGNPALSGHGCTLLEFTLPLYEREGKSSLTLALGCTGGRHRSVVLVEELRQKFTGGDFRIHVKHRDIDK